MAATFVVGVLALAFLANAATAAPDRAQGRVYANDRLWATFGTADFKHAPANSVDVIFVFPGTTLIPVAEASPGDPDYNGGRWDVREVRFTGIAETQFTNDEDVWYHAALGHLEISGNVRYFQCPLFPL